MRSHPPAPYMKISVRTFASVSDICGFREREFVLADGGSVGGLLEVLVREHPGLAALKANLLSAVNEEHSPETRILSDGDVVAFFPPVSGG